MPERSLIPRLRDLPAASVLGREFPVATGFQARLLGLTYLDRDEAGPGLFIPRCASVHTFGMRFALDLCFLDQHGEILRICREVPPGRVVFCRHAAAVLEIPAGKGGEFSSPGT